MAIVVREVAGGEADGAVRVEWTAFGERPGPEIVRLERATFEPGRALVAVEDGDPVGTARAWSTEIALPGGTGAPAAAVSGVAVLPTHRRRGILRAMMARQLADIRERGEPLAALIASEAGIYGRFGYGAATFGATMALRRGDAGLVEATAPPGRFRLLDAAAAAGEIPPLYERLRRAQPGEIRRIPGWWEGYLADVPENRGGASARFFVVWEPEPGRPAGFAAYRIKGTWDQGLPGFELRVTDLYAAGPEARRALWWYLLGVDLVETLVIRSAPLAEPLRFALTDPRRLRVTDLSDHLWVRLVDVPAALAARRYASEGRLVLAVADAAIPANHGAFALTGGPGGAECRRAVGDPDLTLDVADLGSAYLGGVRLATLARAGRVAEHRPGALARADAMLATDPPPWCGTDF